MPSSDHRRGKNSPPAIFEALDHHALVSVTDTKGNILFANHAFSRISKYSPEELIGQNHRILKSGHQPDSHFAELWKTITDGKVWHGELKNKAKDGTYFWVDVSISPVLDEHGKIYQFLGVHFLITERKEKEDNFAALLKALDTVAAVSISDIDGNITYANHQFLQLSKYEIHELMGNNHRMLKSGDQPDSLFKELWKTIASGKVWRGDIKNRAKDNTYFWVDTAIAPILNPLGKPERYISIRFPITEKKSLDSRQQEFISLASHQLRTPITALRLCIELLSKGKFGALTKEQQDVLHPAMGYAVSLAETVHTLLAVSRIEAGTVVLDTTEITAQHLLEELRMEHEFWYAKKRQHIDITCPDDAIVHTDKGILREILANLFSNAIRYTPENGRVSIHVTREGKAMRFDVSDTGMGIPKAAQGKIFEKFFRADNARNKVTDGTGLGLYLANSLAVLIGGRIEFVSEENKGTTFSLVLPDTPPGHGL